MNIRFDSRSRKAPRVSVVADVTRGDFSMLSLLHNLFSQSMYLRGEAEIVLLEQTTSEGCQNVIVPYLQGQSEVIYGEMPANLATPSGRELAANLARGEYIIMLPPADRLRSNGLEIMADELDRHPAVHAVRGRYHFTRFDHGSFSHHVHFGHESLSGPSRLYTMNGVWGNLARRRKWEAGQRPRRGKILDCFVGLRQIDNTPCNGKGNRLRDDVTGLCFDMEVPGDYLTIVCHTMSFDRSVLRPIKKIFDNLWAPFIIYAIDQNSSPATVDSLAYLAAEGMISAGSNLLPHVQQLFHHRIAYRPTIRFSLLVQGETFLIDKNFMAMDREQLTSYVVEAHKSLTAGLRTSRGMFDPLRVGTFCDHHECERLDLAPHCSLDDAPAGGEKKISGDMAVFIQHYAPPGQTDLYRRALQRCLTAIRNQDYSGKVIVVVTDDGSDWSKPLAGDDPKRLIRVHRRQSLQQIDIAHDIDADLYLYKKRTGFFSKGILWNAAVHLVDCPVYVFLDDDHYFKRPDALRLYAQYLQRYELVVGNTTTYNFRDIDGVLHRVELDYDSPVVQGSNFGLRRDLFKTLGGFDQRTFLWGTGDDPAFFWKLYLQLCPLTGQNGKRACYVEDIITDNPYSGRWRTDCRLDLELFIRDFLRIYGTHPNANPSRTRRAWMDRIPARQSELQAPAVSGVVSGQPAPAELGLTIVIPAIGADFRILWTTVASVLEQRLPASCKLVIAARPEDLCAADVGRLPAGVQFWRVTGDSQGETCLAALRRVNTQCAAWLTPGTVLAEKTIKGALTALQDGRERLVYGGHMRLDAAGLRPQSAFPPGLAMAKVLRWGATWQPGQPVFGHTEALLALERAEVGSELWDMDFFLSVIGRESFRARERIFSLHVNGVGRKACTATLARLISSRLGEHWQEMGAGTLRAFQEADTEQQPAEESQRLLFWFHEHLRRLRALCRLFQKLAECNVRRLNIYGAGRHTYHLLSQLWPTAIEVAAIFDDYKHGEELFGIRIQAATEENVPPGEPLVLSARRCEAELMKKSKALGCSRVFPIYHGHELACHKEQFPWPD